MGLYSRFVLPRLTHLACGARPNRRLRERVVPQARGAVLEIGFGSGLNLPHYHAAAVSLIWALEPHPGMRRLAAPAVARSPIEVRFLELPAGEIPLADGSVDTVLMTYTLCSIADPQAALAAMARVLKPDGALIFCEHGASPDAEPEWEVC